jgi:hypothetical protein
MKKNEALLKNYSKEKCSCGFDMSNKHIQHHSEYSNLGWILYWIGISAKPVRVSFKCSKCDEVIESTDNPEILKKYVGR